MKAAFLALAIAAPAFAQDPVSAPRAIPLPDTLGANFDVADTLKATSVLKHLPVC